MLGKTVLALGIQYVSAKSYIQPEVLVNEDCRYASIGRVCYLKNIFSPKDLELADKCESLCVDDLMACVDVCDDEPCKSACYRDEIHCVDACPCHTDCYDGCETCPNDICFEEDVCDVNPSIMTSSFMTHFHLE